MDVKSLALSFSDSLTEEVSGCVGEFVELGIDSMMEDGLLKDIPFISTAVSIYRIGKNIRERHHVAKLAVFLNEINKGVTNEAERREYRKKFQSNEKFRNQELEFTLILIDRYIGFEKPQLLAKVYLAYLNSEIDWHSFTKYAEIIDRLLPRDYLLLDEIALNYAIHNDDYDVASRLVSVGLAGWEISPNPMVKDGNLEFSISQKYTLTGMGWKLKKILDNSLTLE